MRSLDQVTYVVQVTKPKLLTTAQAADRLGVSISTTGRMVRDGRLIAQVKVPGQTGAYLFEPDEVERVARERSAEQVPA